MKTILQSENFSTEDGANFTVSATVEFKKFGTLNEESKKNILSYISNVAQNIYMDSAAILNNQGL